MTKKFLEILSDFETDSEIGAYLKEKIEELPTGILTRAVWEVRQAVLANNPELFVELASEKRKFGYGWVERTYFGFGIRVRNMLRIMICNDDELPDNSEKDWSFYYIQIVEMSLGLF